MRRLLTLQNLLLVAVALTVIAVLYLSSFSQPFDKPYLLDFYEHSQWKIPQSSRVMSDNELYQVAGIKLVEGESIFSINPEVPPLGKYIYGFAAKLFGNPYTASVLMYLLLGVVFYAFSSELSDNRTVKLVLLLLLLSTPIVADQVSRTMLDLPMTLFLVIHGRCIVRLLKQKAEIGDRNFKAWPSLIGAGLSLGAVAACKVPFFVPVIILGDMLFMWRTQLKNVVFLVGLSAITYVATFSAYFAQGHGLIEWLKAQKWMIHFYLTGGSKHIPFFDLITITTGWYKDWWGQSLWRWTSYWTPLWPAGVVAMVGVVLKSKLKAFRYPAVLGLLMIAFQGLQPFWPRYFLLVIPFALVTLIPFLEWLIVKKHVAVVLLLVLLSLAIGWYFFRLPPDDLAFHFMEDWNQGDYQDAYNFIEPTAFDRNTFWTDIKQVDAELGLQHRQGRLTFQPVSIWDSRATGEYTETLPTALGPVEIKQPIGLERQGGRWRMIWNPSVVIPTYEIGSQVKLVLDPIPQVQLFSHDGILLSQNNKGTQVWLDLSQVKDVEPVVSALSQTFGQGGTEFRTRLLVESLPGQTIFVGLLPTTVPPDAVATLKQQPGISFKEVTTSDRRYSDVVTKNGKIESVKRQEALHPELTPTPAGSLTVIQANGKSQVLLYQPSRSISNVVLPLTLSQLLAQ